MFVWLLLSAGFTPAQVVLNEIMANNQSAVANDGAYPDWVELRNTSGAPVNIADWSITDAVSQPRKFVFPANTVIPAGGYLVVWLDDATNSPGIHTRFTLNHQSDDVSLYNASFSGSLLQDTIAFGLQVTDQTIGRVPDGTGAWALTQPTFELPNQAMPLGSDNLLKVNEIMASPSSGDDWFELYNGDTTNHVSVGGLIWSDAATAPTNRTIPNLSFIAPGGFIQFIADDLDNNDADHVDFQLRAAGERVVLYRPDRVNFIDRVDFGQQTNGVSYGRLPDGGTNLVFFAVGRSTPAASNFQLLTDIIINEVLTHTDPPLEDAIELYNPTAAPVQVGGWWLSNSKDDPKKFRIPIPTEVPAGGYKVFYENPGSIQGFNSNGFGTNRSFTLNSARGDQVYLHTADAAGNLTFFRTSRDFGPAENGVSFGRYVTSAGTTDFVPMSRHTFGVSNPTSVTQFRTGAGASNAYPKIGPIVISEIMYHPPDIVTPTNSLDNSIDEYIELYNASSSQVLLYDPTVYPFADGRTNTWRLRGVVDFDFPQNVSLASGAYMLVVNFNPTVDVVQLAAFRAKYGVPPDAQIFGPYKGKLQNGDGSVELYKPDPPQAPGRPDAGLVPYIAVDRVKYFDSAPWPLSPDGDGPALQRMKPEEYGNDPINWTAGTPNPGRQLIRVESVQRTGTTTTIRFTGFAYSTYTVQQRSLLTSNTWTKLSDVSSEPTTGTRQVNDSGAGSSQFYRIVSPTQ